MVFIVTLALLAVSQSSFDEISAKAESLVDADPPQAISLFKKALAIQPNWAEGWLYMGASYYHLNQFSEAREALRNGSALEPNKGTPKAFIGLCDYELGDFDAALTHVLEAEKLGLADNPAFVASVRYHTALLYIRLKDFHHAVEQVQPLASNASAFPEILNLLGEGVLNIHNPDKAALVSLAGKATFDYYALRAEDAKADFAQLEARYPNEPGVHYAEGIYLLQDSPDKALSEFQRELQIQPASVLAMQQMALLLIKSGRNQEAVQEARKAVSMDPSNASSQSALGRALLASGALNDAITALERAAKLSPSDPQMHFHLEQAYRRAGRLEDARHEKSEFNRLQDLNDPLRVTPTSAPR
jgi:Flp pilus assembly protein TadD